MGRIEYPRHNPNNRLSGPVSYLDTYFIPRIPLDMVTEIEAQTPLHASQLVLNRVSYAIHQMQVLSHLDQPGWKEAKQKELQDAFDVFGGTISPANLASVEYDSMHANIVHMRILREQYATPILMVGFFVSTSQGNFQRPPRPESDDRFRPNELPVAVMVSEGGFLFGTGENRRTVVIAPKEPEENLHKNHFPNTVEAVIAQNTRILLQTAELLSLSFPTPRAISPFIHDLSALIPQGYSLAEAVGIMESEEMPEQTKKVLATLQGEIQKLGIKAQFGLGTPLTNTFLQFPEMVDAGMVGSIKKAEEDKKLSETLKALDMRMQQESDISWSNFITLSGFEAINPIDSSLFPRRGTR